MNHICRQALLGMALFVPFIASSQKNAPATFDRIEPPNWWVGMRQTEIQVLFYKHDASINEYEATANYAGVNIKEKVKVENPHYLFLRLQIDQTAKAGLVPIQFKSQKKTFTVNYELKNKSSATDRAQGFGSSDVVYLIFPDRFANGDTRNDTIPGVFQGTHREKPYGRHGGDLKGISDHLDYVKDLGATAIWINPVLENNQKRDSYHGYAITDLYSVDRRFGSNEEYVALIYKAHQSGIKIIQDMVMNHIGSEHWLMKDLPEQNWIHQFPAFTRSNFRNGVIPDPYKSKADSIQMLNGWFDNTMPDVSQTNPLFAEYLIQNSLWWIEYAGIDGIRMDTYPYNDKYFMKRWANALTEQYPNFSIVGEAWLNAISPTAYWQKGAKNADGYDSNLPSVTDFPLCFAVHRALNEGAGWESGLARLYDVLSQDFQYPDANQNLTFLDNHDLTRYYRVVGRDLNKFKMGLVFLLTTRGVPQLYYGTEALMDGDKGEGDAELRKDFYGGWAGDRVDFFKQSNLTSDQQLAYQFLKKLLNWRKSKTVIHKGKLTHFIPQDNVYVYFRTLGEQTVMVILNGNTKEVKLSTHRFAESIKGKTKAKNILTDASIQISDEINLPPMTSLILELE
ncbi:MAG TPA: glycoside hydrolase family 13 protein [Cyclobacteriaceae bacterium]|jgi:glycosidase|nr:glycoside hydrolase family 13 protein [Cyclobacteriaceae bacterium]